MQRRRQIVLINRKFQFRLIAKFIAVNTCILILFGIIIYIFLNSEVQSNLQSAHVTYRNIKDMLFPIVITLSIINILISSAIIAAFVLFASHKIAGPLFRFNEALEQVNSRNLTAITSIRDEDQLYECSLTLTEAVNMLSGDISSLKEKIQEIHHINSRNYTKEKMDEKIAEIEKIIGQYVIG